MFRHRPIFPIMKTHLGFSCTILLVLVCVSCRTPKDYAYISDAERDKAQRIIETYASTIQPGDELYIYVESETPESVLLLNKETNRMVGSVRTNNNVSDISAQDASNANGTQLFADATSSTLVNGVHSSQMSYLVDNNGQIEFPMLGKITVAGLTQDFLKEMLEQRLRDSNLVSDPIVTTSLTNFRVAVVGEVKNPQQLHVAGTRLTIFEALALVGDVTINGLRNNITVVRSNNGVQEIGEIDLTSKEVFDSPYYYLQQNDIVYVEPDKLQKKRAYRNSEIPKYISIGVSVWHLISMTLQITTID